MLNYQKLMAQEPTSYGKMVNDKNQIIEFFEHPFHGDEAEVIAVSVEAKSSCLKYCSKFALCLMAIAFSLC
jgi:hypothetical protein